MGFNQERYFFLSGLISITLFVLLLFSIGYTLMVSPVIEQFAMRQSEYVSVSIVESGIEPQKKSEPQPAEVSEQVQAEESVVEAEPVLEISDLFSQVKADKPPKKVQDDQKRRDELNTLEKELLERKDSPRISDRVSKVELAKPSVKMIPQGGSSGPIVDKYYANIQGIVYANFHPPAGTVGELAKVRLSFSSSGKLLSYRIIRYSGNGSFNAEVDWLKDRLNAIRFPEHPDGKDAVLECILTAKE